MVDPVLTADGDVVIDTSAKYKCRVEQIIIDNSNPDRKVITIAESLRILAPDGTMGTIPVVTSNHGFTPEELASVVIDGLTFLQVMTWIQKWAIGVNLADAASMAEALIPKSPASNEEPVAP